MGKFGFDLRKCPSWISLYMYVSLRDFGFELLKFFCRFRFTSFMRNFSTLYVSLRKTYVNRTHFLFSTTVSRTSMLQNESLKNCRQTERKVFQG